MRRSRRSLRRLQAPTGSTCTRSHQPDPLTPIEETLRALDDLVRAGQGALHRLLQPAGLAGGGGAVDRRELRPERLRLVPGRVQPAGRAASKRELIRDARRIRDGPAAVLSAGQRPADRQVPPQRANARRRAVHRARSALWRAVTSTSANWAIVERLGDVLPRRAATPCWSSRSAGWRRSRRSASVIAGATQPEQAGAERQGRGLGADGGGEAGRGCDQPGRATVAGVHREEH